MVENRKTGRQIFELRAKKKSGFEDTDLGNESYNFLTKTYLIVFKKCARKLRKTKNEVVENRKREARYLSCGQKKSPGLRTRT